MTNTILAWHFTKEPDKLRDGTPFRIGEPVEYSDKLVMCESGLHASIHPMDALYYALGPYLWRVECSGNVLHQSDKLVCSRRTVLAGGNATDMLYRFARVCASDVLHLWNAPDVVKQYLATGENRAAARAAALDAAWAAALDAAWAGAWAAAWAAALDAAWAAAWAAARAGTWAAKRQRFESMCNEWLAEKER